MNIRALRFGSFSVVRRPRQFMVSLVLIAVIAALAAVSLGLGDYPIHPLRVAQVLVTGEATRMEALVIGHWRMPRTVCGIVVGGALGLSGALTQSATCNALASPDILGITTGASTAAVAVIAFGGGSFSVPIATLLGGLSTGLAIWLLAYRRGIDPFRLVLAGIIISALLTAVTSFIMTRAQLSDANAAQLWLSGSLNNVGWTAARPITVVVVLLLPVLAWMSFQLQATLVG